jgi:2-methylfumaryl-CoA isomerase
MTGLAETVDVLGRALGTDFSDEGERYRHRAVLAGLVAEWFSRHDAAEVEEALAATRLLWSPYRTFAELAADDARLLRQRPLFATVDQPGVGRLVAPGSPIVVDGRRGGPEPAPLVGQDTRTVLAETLGLSENDLEALATSGIVRHSTPSDAVA